MYSSHAKSDHITQAQDADPEVVCPTCGSVGEDNVDRDEAGADGDESGGSEICIIGARRSQALQAGDDPSSYELQIAVNATRCREERGSV